MKKLAYFGVAVIVVLAAEIAYAFLLMTDNLGRCVDLGGEWVESNQYCDGLTDEQRTTFDKYATGRR
jgi:hypothetical protein